MVNPLSAFDGLVFLKISHSVGKGGSNRHDDVQLIQFMLNVIHLDPGNSFRLPSLLSMDGICGARTLSAILAYQEHKKSGEFPLLAADGVVTATHHAVFMDPHHFGFSTIYNLNWDYLMAVPRTDFRLLVAGFVFEPLLSTVILPLQKAGVL